MQAVLISRRLYKVPEVRWNRHLEVDGSALANEIRKSPLTNRKKINPLHLNCFDSESIPIHVYIRARAWWRASAGKLAPALTRLLMSVPIGHTCGVQIAWPDGYPCRMPINRREIMLRDPRSALIRNFRLDDRGSADTMIVDHSENRLMYD